MTVIQELSAGVIPYRWDGAEDVAPLYLILHSATVRNPRARWEFPKGGIEPGETIRQAAAREFLEETSLRAWTLREDFERSLSYTYIRKGSKVLKTVTYYLAEVHDPDDLACSFEHAPDPAGDWHHWGTFDTISRFLYHAKIRQLFAEADAFIRGMPPPPAPPDLNEIEP
jgi:8-oxo-dGTP pyrophosphatase MutT (NUDIX family)